MKKADLKLYELPDTYAADRKYCSLSRSVDFEIGLFSWTEEDEEDDDFYEDDFLVAELTENFAGVDRYGIPGWFKIKTESLLKALSELNDDSDCKIIYCLWHDGSRQDEYFLKPVAHNAEWTYFELGESRWW